MGEVYLAEDTKLGRRVAMKFLPAHLVSNEEIKARFVREAQTIAKLNHPNIVSIHDVSEFNARPYYVMELVEGDSLHTFVHEKTLPFDLIIEYAIQICQGLGEAHRAGIVHRDIKAANIIVDNKGRIRLLDFGLAAMVGDDRLTRTGSTLGTVSYMSPEQVSGREIDNRSDLFSFGIVLYELITGRTPFKRESEGATLKAIIEDPPEPLTRYKSDIPEKLQDIVNELLEKDKEIRYQSAEGVIADLKRLVYDSTQSGYTKVVTAKPKKRRIMIGIAAAITIAASVGLYFLLSPLDNTLSSSDKRPMIAVLPFDNLGATDDDYFADGITDEITSRVATLKDLGVIARTSILQYKGTTKRISEIGAELDVDYILEGTIRWDKSGDVDKVRITPQLIRVSDETHLWADNFQRDLSQIFDVQEEIAKNIAGALNLALKTKDHEALVYRPTENLEAYDLYLRARNFLDFGNYIEAIELLDKATKLDKNFAAAFALKSQAHSQYAFGVEMGASEHTRPARLAYQRAFEIQPGMAEAHLARGIYLNLIERDYSGALEEFELALRGQVDEAGVLDAIALVKMRQGEWGEALDLARQVRELDPRSYQAEFVTIHGNWLIHNYDQALKAIERVISLNADFAEPYSLKAQILISMGAEAGEIQESMAEWSRRATDGEFISWIEGLTIFELLRIWNQPIDVDEKITAAKSKLLPDQNPNTYFYIGLLYKLKGEEDRSRVYMDSTSIVIENRVAKARSDTTGRFENFDVNNEIYELISLAYSQTGRHGLAIEYARLDMETLPVEACHW